MTATTTTRAERIAAAGVAYHQARAATTAAWTKEYRAYTACDLPAQAAAHAELQAAWTAESAARANLDAAFAAK